MLAGFVGPACIDFPPLFSGLALCSGPDMATDPPALKSFACGWDMPRTPAPPCVGAAPSQAGMLWGRHRRPAPARGRCRESRGPGRTQAERRRMGFGGNAQGKQKCPGGRAVWGSRRSGDQRAERLLESAPQRTQAAARGLEAVREDVGDSDVSEQQRDRTGAVCWTSVSTVGSPRWNGSGPGGGHGNGDLWSGWSCWGFMGAETVATGGYWSAM